MTTPAQSTDDPQQIALDFPDPDAPPHTHEWQARREAAQAMRRLIGLLATCTNEPADLRTLAAILNEQADVLARSKQLYGRSALAAFDHGRLGNWGKIAGETNPLSGYSNPLAPPMKLWLDGQQAHGRTTLGWQYEGPPSTVHGGYVCALFDHFLGMAQRLTGQPGVTGTLATRFHRPTPLNTELELIGWVVEVNGRKNLLRGEIHANGVLTASCEGVFIFVDQQRYRDMTEGQATGQQET